jgi:hypothetical protein
MPTRLMGMITVLPTRALAMKTPGRKMAPAMQALRNTAARQPVQRALSFSVWLSCPTLRSSEPKQLA